MNSPRNGKMGIGKALATTGLSLLLPCALPLTGCGVHQGGQTEISGSANPSGSKEVNGTRDDGRVATAIDEIDEGDIRVSPDEVPEPASLSPQDTEIASSDITGKWQCSVCVSGESAVKAEGSLSNDLFLMLRADGTGTLSTSEDEGTGVPLTWKRGDGDSAYIECDEGSGNAAVTRSGRLKWHLDGNGEDSYTLWDSRSPASGADSAK